MFVFGYYFWDKNGFDIVYLDMGFEYVYFYDVCVGEVYVVDWMF